MLFEESFKKRSRWTVFVDITMGLFSREVKSKFGGYRLGFAWAIFEPIVHIITFSLILMRPQVGMTNPLAIPYFVLSGIIPFFLFRSATKGVLSAAKSNRSAFSYPIVQPIHSVFAKLLFETFIYVLSFVVIYGVMWLYLSPPPVTIDTLGAVTALLGVVLLSLGFGLILMVLREFYKSVEKIINIIFRPLYFLSGIFYTIAVVPEEYHFIFKWNPIFHGIELFREAIYGTEAIYGSYMYIYMVALCALCIGMCLYNRYLDKLKQND